jgi:hypothetical protein
VLHRKDATARIWLGLQKLARWYYCHQFILLALCGLVTPILVVVSLVIGLDGRTVAALRTHPDRLVHIVRLFGLIALCGLSVGSVFTMSAWVTWVEFGSVRIRGRAWPMLGCCLIALLFIAQASHLKPQIFWAGLAIELTGMVVFWRTRGPLWKVRGRGMTRLAKKRGWSLFRCRYS